MSAFRVFKQCKVHSAWQLTSSCLVSTSALHRTVSSSLCVLQTAHCPSQSNCLKTKRTCKGQSGYERVDISHSPIALAASAGSMDISTGLYILHHSTQIVDVQMNTSKSALTCGELYDRTPNKMQLPALSCPQDQHKRWPHHCGKPKLQEIARSSKAVCDAGIVNSTELT